MLTCAHIHSSPGSSSSCLRLIGNELCAYKAVPPPCRFLWLVKGAWKSPRWKRLGWMLSSSLVSVSARISTQFVVTNWSNSCSLLGEVMLLMFTCDIVMLPRESGPGFFSMPSIIRIRRICFNLLKCLHWEWVSNVVRMLKLWIVFLNCLVNDVACICGCAGRGKGDWIHRREGYENITPAARRPSPTSVSRGCWRCSAGVVVYVDVSTSGRCRINPVLVKLSGTAGGGDRHGAAVNSENRWWDTEPARAMGDTHKYNKSNKC